MTVSTIKFSQFAAGSLANTTNEIVGITNSTGGTNFKLQFPFVWTTGGRPVAPPAGLEGYNSSLGQIEFWNGAAWAQLAAGGSGSVNVGGQYDLAYYATAGAAVSGLMSAPNSLLITNGSSVVGVTDGSNAAAGSVGEFITSNVPYGSAVNVVPSSTGTDITSILLTAGDWDVWGNMQIFYTGIWTSSASIWTGTISATPPDPSSYTSVTPDNNCGGNTPNIRVSISATTRVYLSVVANFSSGSAFCSGNISARRAR